MDASIWEKILPSIIHKAFNTSSAIIGYLDMIERTEDPNKQHKFRVEAKNGVSEIETVFLELGYLIEKYTFDIEPSPFSAAQIIEDVVARYTRIEFYDESQNNLNADFDLFRLFVDLLLRITEHNLVSPSTGKLILKGPLLILEADFVNSVSFSELQGKWGYEMELLQKVIAILGTKVTISGNKISFGLVDNE